jgi:geranylgeranyl pyrophosphate synthase
MARKKTTIYVEDTLLRAAKVLAARTGKKEYEVFEDALRGHLGLEALQTVWSRNKLTEKDALEVAYREIHASRKKKCIARSSTQAS